MGLSSRVKRAVVWTGLGQVTTQGLHFVVLLLLANLLGPLAFGLAGMAYLFILILNVIGELGLGAAIVQRVDTTEEHFAAVFTGTLSLNCLLASLVFLGAPHLSALSGTPEIQPLLRTLAILFPLNALIVVPRARLQKELEFSKLAVSEFLGEVGFGAVGLTSALLGQGEWSLIWANISRYLVRVLTLWIYKPWIPWVTLRFKPYKDLGGYSLMVMGSSLAHQLMTNIDYFVIGRFLGPVALGYYTLAFQLAVMPTQRIVGIMRKVMFPAFSMVQTDVPRLSKAYISVVFTLCSIILPSAIVLYLITPELIHRFYSPEWAAAIVPIQIMAVASIFYITESTESLFWAVKRPQLHLIFVLLRVGLFLLTALTIGLSYGIVGISFCILFSSVVAAIASLIGVNKVLQGQLVQNLRPILGLIVYIIGILCVSWGIMGIVQYLVLVSANSVSLWTAFIMTILYAGTQIIKYHTQLRGFLVSLRGAEVMQ